MAPGRDEGLGLEHLIWVGLSDCLLPFGRILEHLEGLDTWWGRPALRIWEAACWGHNEDMMGIFYIVAKCWSLQRLPRSWGERENCNEKAAWDSLSSCPHNKGGEGRGEGGEGQGQSLDIESFDSEVKGTAGKAMGTSGQGWAGGG